MFEIKNVFCQDNKLGDVLRALAGKVIEAPVAIPVNNAKAFKGKVVMADGTLLTGPQLVRAFYQTRDHFTTGDICDLLRRTEINPKRSGSILNAELKFGFIKHGKVRGEWIVTTKGKEATSAQA